MLGSVSSHSISVEWYDAKAHSSTTHEQGLNSSTTDADEGLKFNLNSSTTEEELKLLHRDSVDLNLILRRGDKLAKPINHRKTTTTTYV